MLPLLLLLLSGCIEPTAEEATEEDRDRATPGSTASSVGTQPSSNASVVVDDRPGDVADADGLPVPGPAYLDLLNIDARLDDGELVVRLAIAGAAPATVDPDTEQVTYLLQIDTESDESLPYDYWVTAEGIAPGDFGCVFTPWTDEPSLHSEEGEFPGACIVDGASVAWTVSLDALDSPETIRLNVQSQLSVNYEPVAEDFAPDSASAGDYTPSEWIAVLP